MIVRALRSACSIGAPMRNLIRRLFNLAGLDISRADGGKPKWSGIAHDYYPINVQPRWGYGGKPHPQIEQVLISRLHEFKALLIDCQSYKQHFASIPYEQSSPNAPHWNNGWFSALDAAALMYFIMTRAPKTYLEVGGGMSTKFARSAITAGNLPTKLFSIDPRPRNAIDSICDAVVRLPLEDMDLSEFDRLNAGDIAFFDGTHRLFTNSDTTVFFLEVLPRLKRGILVHIHDIFWPDDYAPDWNLRLYSEQYALGAMILGGMSRYRIVLPNYFVSTNPVTAELVEQLGIPTRYPGATKPGLSFWLEVI
jgi:Methyltransferase domain